MYPSDTKVHGIMPKRRPNYDQADYRATLEQQMREHAEKKLSDKYNGPMNKIGVRYDRGRRSPEPRESGPPVAVPLVGILPTVGVAVKGRTSPFQRHQVYGGNPGAEEHPNNYGNDPGPYASPTQAPPPAVPVSPPPRYTVPPQAPAVPVFTYPVAPLDVQAVMSPAQDYQGGSYQQPHIRFAPSQQVHYAAPMPSTVIQYNHAPQHQQPPPMFQQPTAPPPRPVTNHEPEYNRGRSPDRALPRYGRRSSTSHMQSGPEAARRHKEDLSRQIEDQKRMRAEERDLNKKVVNEADKWAVSKEEKRGDAPRSDDAPKTKKQEEAAELQAFLLQQVKEREMRKTEMKRLKREEEERFEERLKEVAASGAQRVVLEERRRKVELDQPQAIGGPPPLQKVYHHQRYRLEQEQKTAAFKESSVEVVRQVAVVASNASPVRGGRYSPESVRGGGNSPPPPPVMEEVAASYDSHSPLGGLASSVSGPVPTQLRELDHQFDNLLKGISNHQDMLGAINAKFAVDVAARRFQEHRSIGSIEDNMTFAQDRAHQQRELRRNDDVLSSVADLNKRRLDALSHLTSRSDVGEYLSKFVTSPTQTRLNQSDLGATLTSDTTFVRMEQTPRY